MEPTVAWLEQRFALPRVRAAVLTTFSIWLVSLGTVFSLNLWDSPIFFGKTFFDALDYLTANILMTAGGLATALFCGYCLKEQQLALMFGKNRAVIAPFRIAMRYVVPLFVVVMAISVF
jgi:NSS family neurotransmitter:Na+ symporter